MNCEENTGKNLLGLARAWGAYIRTLASAIILKQAKIESRLNGGCDSTGKLRSAG